jgi:hypothetical protein
MLGIRHATPGSVFTCRRQSSGDVRYQNCPNASLQRSIRRFVSVAYLVQSPLLVRCQAWARLPGSNAELAEPFGEPECADGTARLSAGEQPVRGVLVGDDGLAAAGGDDLEEETGERFGQLDRFASQPEPYLVVVLFDVVDGQEA